MLTSCYAKEPVIIPRGIGFLKKTLLHLILTLRHTFCTLITNITSSLNGTDLLIQAVKRTEPSHNEQTAGEIIFGEDEMETKV